MRVYHQETLNKQGHLLFQNIEFNLEPNLLVEKKLNYFGICCFTDVKFQIYIICPFIAKYNQFKHGRS